MSDSNVLKRVQEANVRAGLKGRCTVRGSFVSLGNATSRQVCRPESLEERSASSRPSRQVATCPRTRADVRAHARATLSSRESVCLSRCINIVERAHSIAPTHPSNTVKQRGKKGKQTLKLEEFVNHKTSQVVRLGPVSMIVTSDEKKKCRPTDSSSEQDIALVGKSQENCKSMAALLIMLFIQR